VSWLAWTLVILAAIANAGAIGVIVVGARAESAEATRRYAYASLALGGLILVLTVLAIVALIPWDLVTGASSVIATQEVAELVGDLINVSVGSLGFVILPAAGGIVLWSRAAKLDKRAAAVGAEGPVWPGGA